VACAQLVWRRGSGLVDLGGWWPLVACGLRGFRYAAQAYRPL